MISASDRLEIGELYARYARHFDANESRKWGALFTPDARFLRPDPHPPVEGTEELLAFFAEAQTINPGMKHMICNVSIDENGGAVRAWAYFFVLRLAGDDAVRLRNFGVYESSIVKHDGAWRFREHRITFWLSPEMVDSAFAFQEG